MLHIQINPKAGQPVYRQIMDQIKFYAASGAISPGSRLPSIRELSRTLAVNPSTVVKAYTELEHEGLLENRQGRGAFLAENTKAISEEEQRKLIGQSARQVWVQASQLGASDELVLDVIEEERLKVKGGNDE